MNFFTKLFGLHQGEEKPEKVRESIISNISFRGANLWILACAILVASVGLNVNSTAVIIGAMLISPLMGPIVGSGFALATYDFDLLKRSIKNLFIATLVGFIVSATYFYLSPFKEAQSELLARTSPTIYDVLIAFFGGIVGAISITRIDKGNPIPGVAIATALMPPLCTAGFGLATLNFKYIAGALYLYSINCFFIGISTFLIIKYLKYEPIKTENKNFDKKVKTTIYLLMALMIIPSFYLAYTLLQEKKYSQSTENFINNEFYNKGYTIIYKNIDYNSNPKKIQLALLSKKFDSTEIIILNQKLLNYNLTNTKLEIKQNTSDLRKDILAEIKKNTNNISEKDLQINNLSNEINSYKVGNNEINKEVKILFPEINEIYFGKIHNYKKPDSITTRTAIIYKSEKNIDESKFKSWLITRFNDKKIMVINEK
ncbi:uncharacterized hydrophobic domain-containing protein [Soonwooa buanensis]|uniref:Uncharacterized hydrophobic domain-containing protein n=1 Tax=Soonwooa buanensis TaxID=619805 RepID=A0A1T5CVD7_9FLAO|nr:MULTISPECIES: DUF389 domain-containing protein [Soonwooa]SKB63337.1 uncharacterized hydrophobic domain-containing protein [Soonwooa buanensis]